ncbi:NPC intracellular cholesterol transporter 1-like [Pollicipes pollicipes]|uniref:NPC intracellular cholesterol transporter 1-like n=1 Tax=Pollicipes pollicipes TaxID=41117 RepID=UPI001884A9DD|nr:NPC intracellular cholesterol transporter 1-like [Pollicipes pollicipes]
MADGRNAAAMKSPTLLMRLSSRFISGFEYLFYQHGYTVCRHPYLYIVTVLAVTAACSIGLLSFHQENRPFKLWIPQDSDFVHTYDWMQSEFPRQFRSEHAILTADNVLEPAVLQEMLRVHREVSAQPATGPAWSDVCARLPTLASAEEEEAEAGTETETETGTETGTESTAETEAITETEAKTETETETETEAGAGATRRRRSQPAEFDVSAYDSFDPSVSLPASIHCAVLAGMERPCWEASLLELWRFDADKIAALTRDDVLRKVNAARQSPVFGYRFNLTRYLGGITRDADGRVTGARAAFFTWSVRRDPEAAADALLNDVGTGEPVDANTLAFETHFLSVFSSSPKQTGVTWYYSAGKSFGEISSSAIFGDVKYLVFGYMVMFMYIQLMLGRCNMVEHRTYLSMVGVFSVALAIVVSFGLCSSLGVFFGPVHNILPLLLLGLGVDDMFVILQCWEMLTPDERLRPLEERVGRTLQHAGVSITVTSLTDFVAFAIGASTVLPSLESFCVYAAVGILAVYFIQATWFVAFFTLDQRRIECRRDGLVPCYTHVDWTPNACSQKSFFQNFFGRVYAPLILGRVGKVVVLVLTCLLLAVFSWGLSQLRQEFNPLWFLPSDSHLAQFHRSAEHYFPTEGEKGVVFVSGVDFADNMPQMALLSERLSADPSIQRVESWYDEFQYYINYNKYGELPTRLYDSYQFLPMLGQFIFSPRGGKFQKFLRFNGTLECGSPAPPIEIAMVSYTHTLMNGPVEQIPAMQRVKQIAKSVNFTGDAPLVQPLAEIYASWETDQVIEFELYRNMGLALLCVFVMVLFLIADLIVCLLVLACVVFTLVDVGGLMFFWGLTIDTVSCIDVVLAIGLCVDYAAHVGHTFLTQRGGRQQRALQTLRDIGPAVFNGGFSTFLAFIFLATSTSHVFVTFFKVFFGVTVFGLYHGLVLLPVLLSLVGPDPYLPSRNEIEMTSNGALANAPDAKSNGHADVDDPGVSEVEYTPRAPSATPAADA